jgi:hypothetical protein
MSQSGDRESNVLVLVTSWTADVMSDVGVGLIYCFVTLIVATEGED